jgi:hypothetical protein
MTALQQARERLHRAIEMASGGSAWLRNELKMDAEDPYASAEELTRSAMTAMEMECDSEYACSHVRPLAEEYAAAVVALRTEEQKESKR